MLSRARERCSLEKLPVHDYRVPIVTAVQQSRVTILTAETGAGKSTCVPLYLADAGFYVIVTQPRRLAVRSLAEYMAEVTDGYVGGYVGYHLSEEQFSGPDTRILLCTDGLQLVRELVGHGIRGTETILVIDEVHEWNVQLETLIAWSRFRLEQGAGFRLLLMSATIDFELLKKYFGQDTPVITVPGRQFPVERRQTHAAALIDEVQRLAESGRKILVFQPGKREVRMLVEELETRLRHNAIVLPLHADLELEQQRACFEAPPQGWGKVVVATTIAQTSVTIPDIDAVVDCGFDRSTDTVDGIEGLYMRLTSHADLDQRAGRAGRTKPGTYVLCSDQTMEERPLFSQPDILRSRLDQVVLRLACQGVDASTLQFVHQPEPSSILEARRLLVLLGAMSEKGKVTVIGQRIAGLPVCVRYGRMLVEAEHLGVVEEVMIITACLESGEMRLARQPGEHLAAWRHRTLERRSDLLAILDLWRLAHRLVSHGHVGQGGREGDLIAIGIQPKNFFRSKELRRRMIEVLGQDFRQTSATFESDDARRKVILQACLSGLVDLRFRWNGKAYVGSGGEERSLFGASVVPNKTAELIGIPWDMEINNGTSKVRRQLTWATAVDADLLQDSAPKTVVEPPKTFCSIADRPIWEILADAKKLLNGKP